MLRVLFLSVVVLLLVHVASALALPACQGDNHNRWTDCEGDYTFPNGDHYDGEWVNGLPHGQGAGVQVNGTSCPCSYVGELKNGNFHGQGTETYKNGEKYVGEWKDRRKYGRGTYTDADEGTYIGDWKNNVKHGRGTYTFGKDSDWAGDIYVGGFNNDMLHGQGTYTSADDSKITSCGRSNAGSVVVGQFKNNIPFKIAMFWLNGDVWIGKFQNVATADDSDCSGAKKYLAGQVPLEILAIRGEDPPPTSSPDSMTKEPPPTLSSASTSMDKAKSQCEALGFEPKTEKYGDCVLTLMEMN